jgi:hypothetical protein
MSTVISEPDIIARRDLIYALLGDERAQDPTYLRRRCAAHERLITHMGIVYWSGGKRWVKKSKFFKPSPEKVPVVPKSMKTKESREEYVKKVLEKERSALGMGGTSEENAIELD